MPRGTVSGHKGAKLPRGVGVVRKSPNSRGGSCPPCPPGGYGPDDEMLLDVAQDGDIDSLQYLLTVGECNINVRRRDGRTPLYLAASGGEKECVQLLLKHGADTSIQNINGWTPLYRAVLVGRTQCVQLLLQHGADVNILDEHGKTPLHWAAPRGHTQCVQLLLQHGADANTQDKFGRTPLCLAASGGETECVQLLLQYGADINIQNKDGYTALHWAALRRYTQCVQLLLQQGADANVQDKDGYTALHWAALRGYTQCVQLLLQKGADANVQNKVEWTPLHCAALKGHTQCVQLLLQHGADVNILDEDWKTPLHWAAPRGHTQCVQLLLQHGDINIQNKNGYTALYWATIYGHTQCVQLLLQHGDINIQNKDGYTALHWAALDGYTKCVQLLLQHRADANVQNKDGYTALHWAALDGHTQCVQLLLQHGADANVQNKDGWTPLHCAALKCRSQCVQLLLQHGADANILDEEGKIPRMLAKKFGSIVIKEQLGRIEIPDVQGYVQTRTLEHLAKILEPAEYTFIDQTNLNSNFPDVFQFQKVQELKVWATKNNCTNIRDLKAGLQAANQARLSRAAVDYYAEVVTEILNMASDEFEALCRTLVTAKHMYISGATDADQHDTSSSAEDLLYDAFIAHSGEDKDVVEPVIEQLEERGVRCCYGRRDFHPGKCVITSMGEAVDGSKRTVVFLSKSFMESPFCKQEREFAKHKAVESGEDVIIPVLMDLPPQQIPRELKKLIYIPIKDEELISKLVKNIKGPTKSPTNGELQNALRDERGENASLRDQIRELTAKLQQCQ